MWSMLVLGWGGVGAMECGGVERRWLRGKGRLWGELWHLLGILKGPALGL